MHKNFFLIGSMVIVLGVVCIFWYVFTGRQNPPLPTTSTAETKTNNLETPPSVSSTQTSDWKTYKNIEYGFSFKYPDYHVPFQEITPSINQGGLYIEKAPQGGFRVGYKNKIRALVSVAAESPNKNIGELRINVYNLSSYTIANIPAGIEFWFDEDQNAFWQTKITGTTLVKSEALLPKVDIGNDLVGYKIAIGDAGEGFEYVLIPLLSKKMLVEILYYQGIGATQGAPIDEILSTFRSI